MGLKAPLTSTQSRSVDAVALGVDKTTNLVVAPFVGTLASASFVADATITGAATNTRKFDIVNKGADGTGTTVMATVQFNSGINAAASDETALTLSAVAHATEFAVGDVLAFVSTHVGTGIADPGGLAKLVLTRTP